MSSPKTPGSSWRKLPWIKITIRAPNSETVYPPSSAPASVKQATRMIKITEPQFHLQETTSGVSDQTGLSLVTSTPTKLCWQYRGETARRRNESCLQQRKRQL